MDANQHVAPIETFRRTADDRDLQRRIAVFLYQQHVPNAQRIRATACVGTVVISGKAPSRHAQRLCIKCCERVAGVLKLIDRLEVEAKQRSADPRDKVAAVVPRIGTACRKG